MRAEHAGVEILVDPLGGDDGDGIGLEMCIQRVAHGVAAIRVRGRHGRPVRRVDSGVGSPCALDTYLLAAKTFDGGLDRELHGGAVSLELPAENGVPSYSTTSL